MASQIEHDFFKALKEQDLKLIQQCVNNKIFDIIDDENLQAMADKIILNFEILDYLLNNGLKVSFLRYFQFISLIAANKFKLLRLFYNKDNECINKLFEKDIKNFCSEIVKAKYTEFINSTNDVLLEETWNIRKQFLEKFHSLQEFEDYLKLSEIITIPENLKHNYLKNHIINLHNTIILDFLLQNNFVDVSKDYTYLFKANNTTIIEKLIYYGCDLNEALEKQPTYLLQLYRDTQYPPLPDVKVAK